MELRVQPHGPHVVVVTIDNQPRRNAMPRAMMAELGVILLLFLLHRQQLVGAVREPQLVPQGARHRGRE